MAAESADRWRRVEEIFQMALECPAAERARFLVSACGEDRTLRSEVDSLIQAHQQPHDLLETSNFACHPDLCERRSESWVGRRVGPYTLLRELGRGGMSIVYLAARADGQLERRVALKLVGEGNHPLLVQRFYSERRILATLDHPNIARLYDGGATDEGLPYFVMEYVEGERIDRSCDARRLGIAERLELFRRVCGAVQYAHQNLVVHRDIKPSNILVTADGTPKLLDFGIAKLLEPAASSRSGETTQTGLRPMTRSYASPEQLRGEAVSTASDVYSLGVLLYELLTGRRPYRDEALAPERIDASPDWPKPSTAVMSAVAVRSPDGVTRTRLTPEEISLRRGAQPARLRRQLAGDVDSIVGKALRPDPRQRYHSVEQLAEDLRRHLEGRPVMARRTPWGYRAGKFVRRNKLAVASVAGFVAVVLVSALAMAILTAQVARERNRARQEQHRASQVAKFLVDLFEVTEAAGNAVSARDLLEQGATNARQMDVEPQQRAELYDALGTAFLKLGLYDQATPFLEDALKIRRQVLGTAHPDVARSLYFLARLLDRKGEFERAEILQRGAVDIRRKASGTPDLELAESLDHLAWLLSLKGGYGEAEKLHRDTLAMRRKLLGNDHPDVAVGLNNLATMLSNMGEKKNIEPLAREAVDILRKVSVKKYLPDLAEALKHLAGSREIKDDLESAETLIREALEVQKVVFGDRHPDIASTLTELGMILYKKRDYDGSERFYRQGLEMRRELLGEEHPLVAWNLALLAQLFHLQGEYEAADTLARNSVRIFRESLPEGSSIVGFPLVHLGLVLTDKGDPESAEPLLREALELRRKALGESSPLVARPRIALGACLLALQEYEEASELLVEGYRKLESQPGQRDWTRRALRNLVDLHRLRNEPEKAAAYQRLLNRALSE